MHTNSQSYDTFKHCPECKGKTISSENGHKYLCANCGYEYFHNTAAAVAAIICCGDEILFTVRAKQPEKDKLDLPGGFVDHNESLEQALSRELKEELDVEIHDWQYFCSGSNSYFYKGITYQTCDAVFVTHLPTKPKLVAEKSEIAEYKWIHKDQVNTAGIGFTSLRLAVQRFLADS
ncbi:NUDIX domain-containing protein [Paraglaciecola sp.]|uniref:NUDIX hydrolase n=1 Tax=Paraglaciecola sp. TaxID=1920173 RepID=UPI003EF9AC1A